MTQEELEMRVIGHMTSSLDDAKLVMTQGVTPDDFVYVMQHDKSSITRCLFKYAQKYHAEHGRLLTPDAVQELAKQDGLSGKRGELGERLVSLLVRCRALPLNSDSLPAMLGTLRQGRDQHFMFRLGEEVRKVLKEQNASKAFEAASKMIAEENAKRGVKSASPPLRVMSASTLMATEWDEPIARISDPRGRLLIAASDPLLVHGDKRVGKTWFLLDLAISLATGLPLYGCFPVAGRCRVLYIGAEGSPRTYRSRMQQLLRLRGLTPDDLGDNFGFMLLKGQEAGAWLTIDDPDSVSNLIRSLKDDPPDIIIIDPLASFMRGEETNDGMKIVVNQSRRITQEIGSQVIISHHDIKNSEAYSVASKRARGGGALGAGAGVLSLEGERNDEGWMVKFESSPKEAAPIPRFEVRWVTRDDEESGGQRLEKVTINLGDERVLNGNQWKILNDLRDNGPAPTQRALSDRSGVSKTSAARELRILLALNLVTRDDAGYAIRPGAHEINNGGWNLAYGG